MSSPKTFHLHLVSDSTGETLTVIAKAVCALFRDVSAIEHIYGLVRSPQQLDAVLAKINKQPGPVFYSLMPGEPNQTLANYCRKNNLPSISVLDPFVNLLGSYLGVDVKTRPGSQHVMDDDYFARIAAFDYILQHDDGQNQDDLDSADVILIGASRTSKTPLCMYLANRGIKAANIPFVKDVPILIPFVKEGAPLADVSERTKPLIVGLTIRPDRLVQIRKNRLLSAEGESRSNYTNLADVQAETTAALRLFHKHRWPIIDTTRRSIEETAAEIINLLQQRRPKPKSKRLPKAKSRAP